MVEKIDITQDLEQAAKDGVKNLTNVLLLHQIDILLEIRNILLNKGEKNEWRKSIKRFKTWKTFNNKFGGNKKCMNMKQKKNL